jgi:hypothetical protein
MAVTVALPIPHISREERALVRVAIAGAIVKAHTDTEQAADLGCIQDMAEEHLMGLCVQRGISSQRNAVMVEEIERKVLSLAAAAEVGRVAR